MKEEVGTTSMYLCSGRNDLINKQTKKEASRMVINKGLKSSCRQRRIQS